MPGWMKLKLELRLLKEISATSDMQMAPWQAPVIIFNKFSFNLWHSGVFLGHIEHLLVPHHWVQLPWYIIIVDQHDVLQNSKRISFLQSVMNMSMSINTLLGQSVNVYHALTMWWQTAFASSYCQKSRRMQSPNKLLCDKCMVLHQ